MMKIKTFKFIVSNFATTRNLYGNRDNWDNEANDRTPVASEKEIDNTINKFIKDKQIDNILINDFTAQRHNNGRADLVFRTYTIMYNE